jgi:hypothetical protein
MLGQQGVAAINWKAAALRRLTDFACPVVAHP